MKQGLKATPLMIKVNNEVRVRLGDMQGKNHRDHSFGPSFLPNSEWEVLPTLLLIRGNL